MKDVLTLGEYISVIGVEKDNQQHQQAYQQHVLEHTARLMVAY